MLQSRLFSKTYREDPKDAQEVNHKLLVRGGYINQTAAGVWSFLPLGIRVLRKIMDLIREEMDATGAQEVFLPSLLPRELWEEAGRWKTIDPPLFTVLDRHKKEYGLGSTHEEVVTSLAREIISSHKQLPIAIYQLQTKFRNEVRATGGLLRTREFMMKDLYSFHPSEESLGEYYETVKRAYVRIFDRCGLKPIPVQASGGTIGGSETEEFMVEASSGEDRILVCSSFDFAANIELGEKTLCPKCNGKLIIKRSIEAGQIFKLGTKYSQAMLATFTDEKGKSRPVVMGCYGIGVSRLLSTVVEIHHDEKGILWPREIAPFQVHLLSVGKSPDQQSRAERLSKALQDAGVEVLFDDRDETPGSKFATSDLIGIPIRLVIGDKTPDRIEWKERSKTETELLTEKEVLQKLETLSA